MAAIESEMYFQVEFLGVTILQGVEFPIFLLIFAWALQQCSATALPVISRTTMATQLYRTMSMVKTAKINVFLCF